MKFDKQALLEAAKELLRTGVLAALGIIVEALASGTFSWSVTGMAALVAALRAVDRYLHEAKNVKATGLVPF